MECQEFTVDPLPYPYNALEPYINEETMKVHHDVLYKKYVDNLNAALKNYPEYCGLSYKQLILMAPSLPQPIALPVFNGAGGAYNHQQYFEMMTPAPNGLPEGALMAAINQAYGSFAKFQDIFKKEAMAVFGSGWTWLAVNELGGLEIVNTANQTTPFTLNMIPIICIDIWEHAYFLQYKAARADYIDGWLKVADWGKASNRYMEIW